MLTYNGKTQSEGRTNSAITPISPCIIFVLYVMQNVPLSWFFVIFGTDFDVSRVNSPLKRCSQCLMFQPYLHSLTTTYGC